MELEAVLSSGPALEIPIAVVAAIVLYLVGRILLSRLARPAYPMAEDLADRARRARSMLLRIWGCVVGAALVLVLLGLLPGARAAMLLAGLVAAVVLVSVGGLLRDVVAGVSILLEGQMGPGDRVRLFGVSVEGVVEDVGLRRTVLRADDGSRVFVRNGSLAGLRATPPEAGRGGSGRGDRREPAPEPEAARRTERPEKPRPRRGDRTERQEKRTPRERGRTERPEKRTPREEDAPSEEGDGAGPEEGVAPRELLPESPWSIE